MTEHSLPSCKSSTLLTRRMHLLILFGYILATILMTWPFAAYLTTDLPASDDTPRHAQRIAWISHQLLQDPLNLFEMNLYYPYSDTFAFEDIDLVQSVSVMPIVLLTNNLVLALNLVIFTSYVFTAYATFLLAIHLTRHVGAAWAAGLIMAFSVFRFVSFPHMNLLEMQWTPLLFLSLDKLLRTNRLCWLFLTSIFGILQVLSTLYYAYIVFIIVAVYVLVYLVASRQFFNLKNWAQLFAVAVLVLIAAIPFALPYLRVVQQLAFTRGPDEIDALSATVFSYLSALDQNWIYGRLLAPFGYNGNFPLAHVLFPGVTSVALAFCSFVKWSDKYVRAFVLVALVSFLLSFGPHLNISAEKRINLPFELPYGWLYDYLPGFQSLRAAMRFDMPFTFALALLAAYGIVWLLRKSSSRISIGVVGLLTVMVLAENLVLPLDLMPMESGDQIPEVYRWLATQPPHTPIAELPIGPDQGKALRLARYDYFSAFHWQPTVTSGYSSYYPDDYKYIYGFLETFPSEATLDLAHEFDLRYMIVHFGDMPGTERRTFQERLRQSNVIPVKQFGTDSVFEISSGEEAFDQLKTQIFVPSPQAQEPLTIYLLLTNPTPHLYFFKPTRRIRVSVNETHIASFTLPIFLESGTAVISTTVPIVGKTIDLKPYTDSLLSFSPISTTIQLENDQATARPVSLTLLDQQVSTHRDRGEVEVTLHWRVTNRVRETYQVEAILVDDRGNEQSYGDTTHLPDLNPTVRWRPGQILQDQIIVTIAPNAPSKLHLVVRMYDEKTSRPLLPLDQAGNPLKEIDLGLIE